MYEIFDKKKLGDFSNYENFCRNIGITSIDECPICGYAILPDLVCEIEFNNNNFKYVINLCPKCGELFVEKLMYDGYFNRINIFPNIPKEVIFDEIISNISDKFVEIYNQSNKAETYHLNEIAGMGYRKALEFLIKDYLKLKTPNQSEDIEKKGLGKCIDLIDNQNIKNMSKGATWLGNDETHYVRKWEDKDINDLKYMIKLTTQWIILEKMTENYQSDRECKLFCVNPLDQ